MGNDLMGGHDLYKKSGYVRYTYPLERIITLFERTGKPCSSSIGELLFSQIEGIRVQIAPQVRRDDWERCIDIFRLNFLIIHECSFCDVGRIVQSKEGRYNLRGIFRKNENCIDRLRSVFHRATHIVEAGAIRPFGE